MNRHRWVGAAFLIAVFALAGFFVYSTTGHAGHAAATVAVTPADQTAPGSAALKAYLNPETGEIEVRASTSADVSIDPETQNALRRDDDGLVKIRHADGSVSMDLQGRYQSVSVVRVNADGTTTITCTDDAKAAEQALNGPVAAPTAPEVK